MAAQPRTTRRPPEQMLSVVVPILDEIDTIDVLVARLDTALADLLPELAIELIFVDDGSTDGSGEHLRELASSRENTRLIELSRNFGHQMAISAGIDHAFGDAVVIMDGDLQDPPEVIPEMVAMWRDGVDVVYGVRAARAGESRMKRWAAALHYRVLNWLSDTPIPLDTGDFRLMSRRVVDVLRGMREEARYIRGMVAWVGFEQKALTFNRDPRFAGKAKYDMRRLFRLSMDGLTSFTDRPLRIVSQTGIVVTCLASLYGAWIVIARLLGLTQAPGGFAATMTTVLVLGGLQLFAIGLIGQYLGRVYRQSKGRPLYVIQELVGWETDARETLGDVSATALSREAHLMRSDTRPL